MRKQKDKDFMQMIQQFTIRFTSYYKNVLHSKTIFQQK